MCIKICGIWANFASQLSSLPAAPHPPSHTRPCPMSEFDQGDVSAQEGAFQPKNILITGGAGFM